MADSSPHQQEQSLGVSNWKGLVAVIVVIVVVMATIGLIYTQPWSKVEVSIINQDRTDTLNVVASVDGKEFLWATLIPNQPGIIGVYDVKQGSHFVSVTGNWTDSMGSYDGQVSWSNTYSVGPLFTQKVVVRLIWT